MTTKQELIDDVKEYINILKNESPIVSYSHRDLRRYCNKHGTDVFSNAVDNYFKALRRER